MKKWYELAKARMKELKITQENVAEHLGVTQGAVAHWLSGRREPSLEVIGDLLKFLDLPAMAVGAGAQGSPDSNVREISPLNLAFRYPVVSWVAAGAWSEAVEPFPPGFSDHYEMSEYAAKGSAFWLEVKGDSMTALVGQSVPEGTFILVETEADVKPGKLVIAKLADSNEATFKKLVEDGGRRYLKPLNGAYPTEPCADDCRIVGVVVRALMKL